MFASLRVRQRTLVNTAQAGSFGLDSAKTRG